MQLAWPRLTRAALAAVALAAVVAAVFHHGGIQLGEYYAAISGVLLIFTVILNPEGIVGPLQAQLAALREKLRARRAPAAPPLAGGPPPADGAVPAGDAAPAARRPACSPRSARTGAVSLTGPPARC